ncbi:MAG: hypothetical protein ACK578_05405 [Pirellula sp.]|jgi:hypothetical protein
MLAINPQVKIYLHTDPIDMRKSFDGLFGIAAIGRYGLSSKTSLRINSTRAKRRGKNRIQPQCNGLQWDERWMLADRKRLKTLW